MSILRATPVTHWQPALLAGWNALVAASSASSGFLTRQWLTSWWAAFGGAGHLLLLACYDAAGALVGVAPLYLSRSRGPLGYPLRTLRLVGDGSFDSDNLDLIAHVGRELDVARAVLDWLTANRRDWDVLELGSVPSESPTLAAVRSELATRGWHQATRTSPHPVVQLPDSWEAYLAGLSSSSRAGLRKKLREIDKGHTTRLRRCERDDELPEFLAHLYRMHSERWQRRGQSGSFESEARQRFYDTMAKALFEAGWLSFWLLELDGQVVAAEFGFLHGGTHSYLQSGFDLAHAELGVGVVLKCHILQHLIASGAQRYDFLAGAEPYKQRWGPGALTHSHLRCALPRSRGALVLEFAELATRTKAWLHPRLPAGLAGSLRRGYRRLRPRRGGAIDEGA